MDQNNQTLQQVQNTRPTRMTDIPMRGNPVPPSHALADPRHPDNPRETIKPDDPEIQKRVDEMNKVSFSTSSPHNLDMEG